MTPTGEPSTLERLRVHSRRLQFRFQRALRYAHSIPPHGTTEVSDWELKNHRCSKEPQEVPCDLYSFAMIEQSRADAKTDGFVDSTWGRWRFKAGWVIRYFADE